MTEHCTHANFTQRNVTLESGVTLPSVTLAYASRGRLAPDRRNAILVAHGYTSGPEDTICPGRDPVDGSLEALIGPGRAIDTERHFVVCVNALGSSFGSTNAAEPNPATGRPWGSGFPEITIRDIVAGQRAVLAHLGIERLVAVVGVSFGGLQALEWGLSRPSQVGGIVAALCAPRMPGVDVAGLEASLAALPGWFGGDYYGRSDLRPAMMQRRLGALAAFGAEAVLARSHPDAGERSAHLQRLARAWAERFDPNSLRILFRAMATYDASDDLARIAVPVLYVLSRSDRVVPPGLAPAVMAALQRAGVSRQYVEIDGNDGHCAAGSSADAWAGALHDFIDALTDARIDPGLPGGMAISRHAAAGLSGGPAASGNTAGGAGHGRP